MVQKLGRIGIGSAESARFWPSRSGVTQPVPARGSARLGWPIRLGSAQAGPIRFKLVMGRVQADPRLSSG
ncbi:hypothetical protein Taro_027533 [Colocasia esculenta]|uniref:Uncharacterized protein n=1 Tax=Colocasia esculenta TaxID=4460 RepID=A0A843VE58_COLES|nr:hypothetical protein [Colocasia esculenta]